MKSTLAHELMHSVMQYTLTDGMSGRKGEKYPTWFVEGTAQLAGGGFSTGWNDTLSYYANYLTDENDASHDKDYANYLKKFTMSGRPYGHGYLGTAYFGYLAGGGKTSGKSLDETVTDGMNKIFTDNGWKDYIYWQTEDRKTLKKINQLIEDICRNGNNGIGKPEPLTGNLSGFWSRRINDKDRLIYKIDTDNVYILACRYHYDDK